MARLRIENIALTKLEPDAKQMAIAFDVAWDGAWKNEINCDGIWLFAKFRAGQGEWRHVTLKNETPVVFDYDDHAPPGFSSGTTEMADDIGMWVADTCKGVIVFRRSGQGDVCLKQVRIVWDYAGDELHEAQLGDIEIQVFGMELVYVPEDGHEVGDPLGTNGPANCFYTYPDGGAYSIVSETAIVVDARAHHLYCDQDNPRSRDDVPFTVPDTFPKGYRAFWCMKYGLSTRQYVDFLNTLSRRQQNARTMSDISGDTIDHYHVMTDTATEYLRQSIVCPGKNNGTEIPVRFYTYAPQRACSVMGWGDIAAYAAWSGLRPITELEFEKACRGPEKAVASECAWGTAEAGRVDTFDGPDGSGLERKIPTTGLVNACFGGGIAPFKAAAGQAEAEHPGFEGPVSCGLFANSRHEGYPARINDGASYYGIMELSGNLWEPCVTIGHPAGRRFKGTHGEGRLNPDGNAEMADWPDQSGAGTGVRGGVWRSPDASYLAIALRFAAAHEKAERRFNGGCRLGF
jgi:formylglycine-generating enzyme required for sulfatase activity